MFFEHVLKTVWSHISHRHAYFCQFYGLVFCNAQMVMYNKWEVVNSLKWQEIYVWWKSSVLSKFGSCVINYALVREHFSWYMGCRYWLSVLLLPWVYHFIWHRKMQWICSPTFLTKIHYVYAWNSTFTLEAVTALHICSCFKPFWLKYTNIWAIIGFDSGFYPILCQAVIWYDEEVCYGHIWNIDDL